MNFGRNVNYWSLAGVSGRTFVQPANLVAWRADSYCADVRRRSSIQAKSSHQRAEAEHHPNCPWHHATVHYTGAAHPNDVAAELSKAAAIDKPEP